MLRDVAEHDRLSCVHAVQRRVARYRPRPRVTLCPGRHRCRARSERRSGARPLAAAVVRRVVGFAPKVDQSPQQEFALCFWARELARAKRQLRTSLCGRGGHMRGEHLAPIAEGRLK